MRHSAFCNTPTPDPDPQFIHSYSKAFTTVTSCDCMLFSNSIKRGGGNITVMGTPIKSVLTLGGYPILVPSMYG